MLYLLNFEGRIDLTTYAKIAAKYLAIQVVIITEKSYTHRIPT